MREREARIKEAEARLGLAEGASPSEPTRHLLNDRAQAANVKLPTSLGLVLDGKAYTLTLTPRSAKVTRGKSGKSFITMSKSIFSQLLLGVYSAEDAIEAKELKASTKVAEQLAKTLFQQLPGHIPPLDDLLA